MTSVGRGGQCRQNSFDDVIGEREQGSGERYSLGICDRSIYGKSECDRPLNGSVEGLSPLRILST